MKSAILSHSMEMITLDFFAYSNQSLAEIFNRMCLDSINPNNEYKNSLFPLTKSNSFLNILTFLFKFCLLIKDKSIQRGRYLHGGKTVATVTSARSSLYCLPLIYKFLDTLTITYHIVALIPNIQHEISRDVDGLHACKCDKSVIPWFCACTCDNALAHALSHRT